MVIANVLVHQALQMPRVEDDHMVEQISPATPNPALSNAILPWTLEAGSLGLDADALHRVDDFLIEVGAAIEDQVFGSRVVGECFAQLLNNPGAHRVLGHIAVEDSPPVMRNDEEAIENAKSQCRHGKEIHCGDGLTVIAQECRPPLCRLRISRSFSHPAQYGPLGDFKAEHVNSP